MTAGGIIGKVKDIKDERGRRIESGTVDRSVVRARPHRPVGDAAAPRRPAGMSLLPLHLLGSPVLRQRERRGRRGGRRGAPADRRHVRDDGRRRGRRPRRQPGRASRGGSRWWTPTGERFAMINPLIVERRKAARAEEGCLSIPEVYGDVTRPERVVLEALDRDGQPLPARGDGLMARAIQHEIDHLDGILFLDHLSLIKRQMLLAPLEEGARRRRGYLKEVAAGVGAGRSDADRLLRDARSSRCPSLRALLPRRPRGGRRGHPARPPAGPLPLAAGAAAGQGRGARAPASRSAARAPGGDVFLASLAAPRAPTSAWWWRTGTSSGPRCSRSRAAA